MKEEDGRVKIVLLSPLPPPSGGIATWTSSILRSRLTKHYKYILVNTRITSQRGTSESCWQFPFSELARNGKIIFNFLYAIFYHSPKLVHINNASWSFGGIFRDLLLATISIIFRKKVIIHFHDCLVYRPKSLFYRFLLTQLIKTSTLIITLDKKSEKFIENLSIKHKNYSFSLCNIPNFIDNNKILLDSENMHSIKNVKVLFVGSITKNKGCRDILEVARSLPEIQFTLIGKVQSDMIELVRKIAEPNIKFISEISNREVLKEMQKANIFLLPSYKEGFPLVILEAMANRLPVIATNVGAIPEVIIQNKGGYVLKPGDVQSMKELLTKLRLNLDLRLEMGEFNFDFVSKKFLLSNIEKYLYEAYQKVLSK